MFCKPQVTEFGFAFLKTLTGTKPYIKYHQLPVACLSEIEFNKTKINKQLEKK